MVEGLEVELSRKRVRNLHLSVHPPDGRVRISAPLRASDRSIARFVRENLDWVAGHRARIAEEERRAAPRPVVLRGEDGEVWSRFGQALRLTVVERPGRPRVLITPERRLVLMVPMGAPSDVRLAALERWQRRELRGAASRMIEHWSPRLDVAPQFLGIKRMRTRWGTCVPQRGRIWLSLALASREPAQVEYVVVHELVHLLEGSHGRRFVALMDTHLPDWRARKEALDRAGASASSYGPHPPRG
jgi:predicted metal-dependent hydrolase